MSEDESVAKAIAAVVRAENAYQDALAHEEAAKARVSDAFLELTIARNHGAEVLRGRGVTGTGALI